MKKHLAFALITSLLCWNTLAQTADDLVAQGRAYLSAQDIADANNSFAQALALSPTNEDANLFYAASRVLVLPNQPAGFNFLTRLGVPLAGRNIYDWTALPPKDANGLLLAPAGVDADEFTAQLRTNALLQIAGAITNLAVITDTNFTVSLTGAETVSTAVTLDYGDLKLIRAGLYGAEYSIYLLNAQNLDAQLTAIRALFTNGSLTIGNVLADYPELLTFATTNDLLSARAAFTNAVNDYTTASAFIRDRPADTVRLFNLDPDETNREADFRSVLTNLLASLSGVQVLALSTNYSVCLSNQFTGATTWRSLLPAFDGNDMVLGTFPDLTFGGLIKGLALGNVEKILGKHFTLLPVGGTPGWVGGALHLPFNTVPSHYYMLQVSADLASWNDLNYFTATSTVSTLVDQQAAAKSKGFYRLRDDSAGLVFAGTVLDQNTGLPIPGATIASDYDSSSATSDASGNFYLTTTLSPRFWSSDYLTVSAPGYETFSNWYYSNGLAAGLQIFLTKP